MTDIADIKQLDAATMRYAMTTDQRFRAIVHHLQEERMFQDRKHGSPEQNPHTPAGWMLLVRKELDEAEQALVKGGAGRDSWRQELLQVAATCIACLEQHGLADPPIGSKREI